MDVINELLSVSKYGWLKGGHQIFTEVLREPFSEGWNVWTIWLIDVCRDVTNGTSCFVTSFSYCLCILHFDTANLNVNVTFPARWLVWVYILADMINTVSTWYTLAQKRIHIYEMPSLYVSLNMASFPECGFLSGHCNVLDDGSKPRLQKKLTSEFWPFRYSSMGRDTVSPPFPLLLFSDVHDMFHNLWLSF